MMWTTEHVFMALVSGIAIGVIVTMAVYHGLIKAAMDKAVETACKIEEEKERNDPANYWKYGLDPDGNSNYRDDIS